MSRKAITTLMVLEEYEDNVAKMAVSGVDERLMAKTGLPEKVVYAAMEREDDRGYLEYGVSLRCGWLTEQGKACLAELRLPQPNLQGRAASNEITRFNGVQKPDEKKGV